MSRDAEPMRLALAQARLAAAAGDVPIGAVLVRDSSVVAEARNTADALGHAELLVLGGAARHDDLELYVTLEPCAMCAGAIVLARVRRLVFGAWDPKAGACGSRYNIVQDPRLNHHVDVERGVLADECAAVLSSWFAGRRALEL